MGRECKQTFGPGGANSTIVSGWKGLLQGMKYSSQTCQQQANAVQRQCPPTQT
jgi:hypothetical protein